MALFSLEVEKHALSGLVKYPEILADTEGFHCEKDYFNDTHYSLFCIIRDCFLKNEKIDKVLLGQKAKNLGIKYKDDIDIFEYIDAICLKSATKDMTKKAIRELGRLRLNREMYENGKTIVKFAENNNEESVHKTITKYDQICNSNISVLDGDNEPENLFEGLDELIIERGNNPKPIGLATPYEQFHKLYGGLRDGGLYAWISRPSEGKSSVLNDLAAKMALMHKDLHVLILDTEMKTVDMKLRIAASITGVPFGWLEDGTYRNNKFFYEKYQKNRHLLKIARNVQHQNAAGVPTKEIESRIRRWYYKVVGRGGRAMVIYDYLKLTGEKDTNLKEYQLIGEKVDSFKVLATSLNIPFLTACQANRSATQGLDDSSVISQSDRLQWFADGVFLFRRKTLEELNDHGGIAYGSHLLKSIKTRFQGKEAMGHFDKYKIKGKGKTKDKYVDFYINFNVDNFNVEERGTIVDVIEAQKLKPDISNNPHGDDTVL